MLPHVVGKICAIGLVGALAVSPALACDIDLSRFPQPRPEERIQKSTSAFIGTVTGFRDDTGEVMNPGPGCSGWNWETDCKLMPGVVMTAILSVDTPLRGVSQKLFESPQTEDGACRDEYIIGEQYLVTDGTPSHLKQLPGDADIARWRGLPGPAK